MRNLWRRKVSLAMMATAVAVIAAVSALNPLSGGQASTSAPPASFSQLGSALPVLGRPATSSDTLPPSASAALAQLAQGTDASLARRALVNAQGTSVYLVPSESGLCLVDTTGSEDTCFTTSQVLGGQATASDDCSPSLPNGDTIEITGILPDGVSNAAVVLTNGARVPLEVVGNVYLKQFARHAALPTEIEWESSAAGGKSTTSAEVPSDVATETCVTPNEIGALVKAGKIPPPSGRPGDTEGKKEINQG